jgi:3-carboxy-cis,cis-muconate cycloisomerase
LKSVADPLRKLADIASLRDAMPSTVFDSVLFRDAFGTPAMRAIFCDERYIAQCTRVEVALARVQGKLGVIPADAAQTIEAKATTDGIDYAKLKHETDIVGYPIVGLVHQLAKQCGDAGRFIHWGATTQDIMDMATVLQVRDAIVLIEMDLVAINAALAGLSAKHRDTVMAGRTHLQHALPITFGHKTAIWLSMIRRHRERLEQVKPRVLVGQFAGAAGTLASLGKDGMAVHDALMADLGLSAPSITWHVARDNLAEVVGLLALIAGSLAKIATDIMLMMQTEVGEVFEPFVKGRGSSSTMPQKRNPISCELILAAAKSVRQNAGLMLDAMASDHERATGPWHLEWIALPEAFIASAGALGQARFMLEGLIVEPERMRRNLDITGGLIVAEAVMMALAQHTGRGVAHDLVYGACRQASEQGTTLLVALKAVPEVTKHFNDAKLAALVDPANYVGSAGAMVDRLLAKR